MSNPRKTDQMPILSDVEKESTPENSQSVDNRDEHQIEFSRQNALTKSDYSEDSESFSTWVLSLIQIIGNLSNSNNIISDFQKHKINSLGISQLEPHLYDLLILIQKAFIQFQRSLAVINEVSEADFPKIMEIFDNYELVVKKIQEFKHDIMKFLDYFEYQEFSFCANCHTLEKTIDFQLCEDCHQPLIKGREIQAYFENHFISKEIALPEEVIQVLQQKFTSKVKEFRYTVDGKPIFRQFIEIPQELKLRSESPYLFFVVDEKYKIVSRVPVSEEKERNISQTDNTIGNPRQGTKNTPLFCRNCEKKMIFLRSTVYYDTTADLFKCQNCGMELLVNIQPIWESGIKDED